MASEIGLGGRIRTYDFLGPSQGLCQTELHPDWGERRDLNPYCRSHGATSFPLDHIHRQFLQRSLQRLHASPGSLGDRGGFEPTPSGQKPRITPLSYQSIGRGGGTRTPNRCVMSAPLYQLSYTAPLEPPVGIEPTSSWFEARCSDPLSYRGMALVRGIEFRCAPWPAQSVATNACAGRAP